ncbi:MAG: corrinoid protein [Candidatus Aminicenantes bacterium]|nr:corrinoid protein [Candidatus Aminicenantes bacterium]
MEILNQISQHLQMGDDTKVAELTKSALDQQKSPLEILNDGLIAGMNIIGDQFRVHEIFLPDVLLAAKAMYAGMDLLKPMLIEEGIPSRGKIVIGSVQGDLHDIGKNLVSMMMEGAGFTITDLGVDIAPEKFVQKAQEIEPDIVAMSALLSTTMPAMPQTIEALQKAGIRDKVKVMIGGAPVTENYAREIKADSYASDAGSAVIKAKKLLSIS